MPKINQVKMPPNNNYILVAHCPNWNELGFQICTYSESHGFNYLDQPNDTFHSHVIGWDYLLNRNGDKIIFFDEIYSEQVIW